MILDYTSKEFLPTHSKHGVRGENGVWVGTRRQTSFISLIFFSLVRTSCQSLLGLAPNDPKDLVTTYLSFLHKTLPSRRGTSLPLDLDTMGLWRTNRKREVSFSRDSVGLFCRPTRIHVSWVPNTWVNRTDDSHFERPWVP